MYYTWLLPLLAILALLLLGFYLIVRFRGGSGVRTEGRTMVDKPDEDEPPVL
jgi:flagellar biogenesis protein FliO